ncbi:hypothetical protein [Candidatus Blastococcus massiliensis]|uniref:hypothetical protein n=1 Tax=Candidatus Blastococcus massiliensis TaxID=1470358 RepID=UPI0012DE3D3D|nr:hypothetical protein [Candidatus Blastococcus massiliensis]
MTGFPLRPLWTVADEVRLVVEPATIDGDVVHYNIPALEATGEPTVEPAANIKSGKLLLSGDEVLISRLNPRKSRVARARPAALPLLASTEFVPLRPVDCDPRFLTYCLLSESTRQHLDSQVRSVTRSHQRVEPLHITHLQIPTPNRDQQERIANFLDDQLSRLDRLTSARVRQLSLLDERLIARLEQRVLDLAAEFDVAPLGRYFRRIEQGWSPQCEDRVPSEQEWGVLKVSAVKAGTFRADESKALPTDLSAQAAYEVRPGDLLISRANSPRLVGEMAVVPNGSRQRLLLCDKLFRLRLKDDLDASYVALIGRTRQVRDHFALSATGTSQSMVNIRTDDLRALALPVPPLALQETFVEDAEADAMQNDLLRSLLSRQMALTEERRQSLITAAVSGQFDVTTARAVA